MIKRCLEATAACEDENIGMATETMMDIVQWLLAKNIIQQQHTFVYFMCPDFSREAIITSQNLDTLPGSHDNNRNEFKIILKDNPIILLVKSRVSSQFPSESPSKVNSY